MIKLGEQAKYIKIIMNIHIEIMVAAGRSAIILNYIKTVEDYKFIYKSTCNISELCCAKNYK